MKLTITVAMLMTVLMAGLLMSQTAEAVKPGTTVSGVDLAISRLQAMEQQLTKARDDMQQKSLAAQSASIVFLQTEGQYKDIQAAAREACKGQLTAEVGVWKCVVEKPAPAAKK